ncbi:neuropeptide FF receptor 1-like [Myxocyprinus asiaticus]|uniref:neuropeptide FF receptor 1-like n=1 Tax=Myxocyprinus asiaticus TaxID=70543 RepID=UPI0022220740|nr:neuropeptide FF receptor 1-like [Myxocyprinus asiaticus]XP_051523878.1 neuropeptide FF receptor 1-like [Myxocyprinus asiaticus]
MELDFFYTENISINHSTLFNDSRNITFLPYYQHSLAVATLFILAYILIFSLCMLGNILVCFIVLKNRQMRTVTNIFILNLAISDLLVGIFCLPITLVDNLITGWPFDVVICKMSGLVQGASVSASVFTLVAIAVERFRCIVYPFQQKLTQREAIIMIAFIWALATAIMCPSAVTLTISQDVLHFMVDRDNITYPLYTCWEAWPDQSMRKMYTTVLFSLIYLAPVTLIVIMYTRIAVKLVKSPASIRDAHAEESRRVFRRKLRVVNMLLIVALLFTISWLPLWILIMLTDYGNLSESQLDLVAVYIFPFAHWLAFFNSSVNPVVYGYFNENFRRGFQAAFKFGLCLVEVPPQPGRELGRRNSTWKHNRVFADGNRARGNAKGNGKREFYNGERHDELVLEDLD